MAMERIIMAEISPEAAGPVSSTSSPEQAGSTLAITPRRESPVQVASNFDLNRRDYQTRIIGNYVSWVDPLTGKEVARMPKVEGGAIPVLETELNPEGKSDDDVVDIMLTIDNFDPGTRELYKSKFQQAADVLKEYANKSKLLGLEWEVSDLERKRKRDDQVYINTVINRAEQASLGTGQGQGKQLLELLSRLDATEFNLDHFQKTLGSHEYDDLYLEEEVREFQAKNQKYESDKVNLRQQITDMVGDSSFFTNRDVHNQAIGNKRLELEERRRIEKWEEDQKKSAEVDQEEKDLERRLLIGEHPGNVSYKDTFEDEKKDGTETGLSWYFHEAREKGLFRDLDDLLEKKYIQWFDSMRSHRELSQAEAMGLSVRTAPKSYAEIETEIIAYFQALLPDPKEPERPDNVEHNVRWDGFEEEGLSAQDRKSFANIRAEYMKRARSQIMIALKNIDRDRKNEVIKRDNLARAGNRLPLSLLPLLPRINLPRIISGEWNVLALQREMEVRARQQELAVQAEPLYERESYYKISLKGRDRQGIETGADQAAEDIMRGFNDFDLDAIKIRIQTLGEAIQGRRELIRVTEGDISESKAQDIVDSIKDRIENKVNFHLMEWAGQNLQMGLFVGLLARYVQSRGCERLKEFPAMLEGQVGISTWLLLSRKYRLHHRPQGWKGQVRDDDTTNKFLRGNIQDKIAAEVMEYELKGGETRGDLTKVHRWEDFIKNFQHKGLIPQGNTYQSYQEYVRLQDQNTLLPVPDPRRPGQFKDYKILPQEKYKEIAEYLTASQRSAYTADYYEYFKNQIKQKGNNAIVEDLDELRKAREARVFEFNRFQEAKGRAAQAVTIANQIMNIFGESAELGDPSIVMSESKDFMSVKELKLACKSAILDAGALVVSGTDANGQQHQYRVKDSLANIRERGKEWLRKAARAGYDRSKLKEIDNMILVDVPNGVNLPDAIVLPPDNRRVIRTHLAKGFEETGLTQHQFDKLKETWVKLNQTGFQTILNRAKFQDIIKREDLKPLKNNYIADYISSMSQINSPEVRDMVARGHLPAIKNILVRLGFEDRQTVKGTTQQEIYQYSQLIEDSRSFDAEVESLVYYMATHPAIDRSDGNYPPFSPDAIDYGFRALNWGVKRLRHLRGFWLDNLNRTIPRGVDMVWWMPGLDRLAGEMDYENILDLAMNVNTAGTGNGMESVDNPALTQYANRLENMVYLRGKSEGSIGKGEGGLDKDWGSTEKWLVDANGLWKEIQRMPGVPVTTLKSLGAKLLSPTTIDVTEAEGYVDAIMKALGRFKPLITANEALLGENRQALSTAAGYEDNNKKIFRFSEWMLSEKAGSGREEGGSRVQKEIRDIIRLLMMPGTFTPGRENKTENGKEVIDLEKSPSIWEEAMRKLTPSHNPRLPGRTPSYNFELL